jgi:hypothetical protein
MTHGFFSFKEAAEKRFRERRKGKEFEKTLKNEKTRKASAGGIKGSKARV